MPWKGFTLTEQRQRFIEDYQLGFVILFPNATNLQKIVNHTLSATDKLWLNDNTM
jgi:hypothetical protein